MKEMGGWIWIAVKEKLQADTIALYLKTGDAINYFMNAAGQMGDVTTMVHEGGHAIHSFLAHNLPLKPLLRNTQWKLHDSCQPMTNGII
jgi:oligoendopeptidase F